MYLARNSLVLTKVLMLNPNKLYFLRRIMNELALFAGAGGGILGGQLLGWRTVCAVEWEPYPASVLCARQNEGFLPHFPIWDDVQTFDGKPWRGIVDVISGGFPCQDISCAGKGAGITGKRSGMWAEFARIISEVRPQYVFVENSPMLTARGLGTVLGDLASMGFDAEWGVLSAADVGAKHQRNRIWLVAHSNSTRCEGLRNSSKRGAKEISVPSFQSWWETEPNVGRVANGVAARVDRLKAIGNGQVPLCAATAFKLLKERLK